MRQEGEAQRAGPEREEEGQALGFKMGARTQDLELRNRTGSLRGEYISHESFSPSVMVTWVQADGWAMEQMIWSLDYLCNT